MPSMRTAINNMCKECIYCPLQPGTWVQQVEDCVSPLCPLFSNRPLTTQTRALNAKGSAKSRRMVERHRANKER